MPLFGRAELTQRQRLFLVIYEPGADTGPSALVDSESAATTREIELSKCLAEHWRNDLGEEFRLRDLNIPGGVKRILSVPGVTLLRNAEPLLATVPEVDVDLFWKRLLSETVDAVGVGIVLLPETSGFLPSPQLQTRLQNQIRRYTSQA